jgi:putative addiction module killer protein
MEVTRKTLKIYQQANGTLPFVQWMRGLRDTRGKQAIEARMARVRLGNLGDHRPVGEGVIELRFFIGPGYRVYLAQEGDTIVVLLCGGDKGSQDGDIKTAKEYWTEYQRSKAYADG